MPMRDIPFTDWMSKVRLDMNKLLKSIIIIILIQTLAMVVKSAFSEPLSKVWSVMCAWVPSGEVIGRLNSPGLRPVRRGGGYSINDPYKVSWPSRRSGEEETGGALASLMRDCALQESGSGQGENVFTIKTPGDDTRPADALHHTVNVSILCVIASLVKIHNLWQEIQKPEQCSRLFSKFLKQLITGSQFPTHNFFFFLIMFW